MTKNLKALLFKEVNLWIFRALTDFWNFYGKLELVKMFTQKRLFSVDSFTKKLFFDEIFHVNANLRQW